MLRAKKPVLQQARFQAVVYANRGVGKTHFCCSLPNVYYIDTEGVDKYPHLVKMLIDNKSDLVRLNDLSEIISDVKALLSVKHDYKTLVIDSITFPFHLLANLEAERIARKEKSEGTDFGKNLAKAKRLTFELGMLITRLDMNVIIVAHEKTKYERNIEIGKASDVTDKMEYAMGTVLHLRRVGDDVKAYVEKSRYAELKTFELLDFDRGYNTLVERFGNDVFSRETKVEELATPEQIKELNHLIALFNLPEEKINKLCANAGAASIDQMPKESVQKAIDFYEKKIKLKEGETNE